ncbi:MAG: ribonuclease HI [Christensenellales bacterium]
MKKVAVYTDGACSYNPGPGGWAAILMYRDSQKEISGYCEQTTNNRMELFAVISALKALKEPCKVTIQSDSAYVVNAFDKGWIINWEKNGWKNAKKDPVENQDLWKLLLEYLKIHQATFHKIKGHSDNPYNNRCDALAREEITKHRVKDEKNGTSGAESSLI